MAVSGHNRSGIRQVQLSIFLFFIPLSAAHGNPSLATASRRHHQFNQSSVSAVERDRRGGRTVLSDDSAERDLLIGAEMGLGAGLPVSTTNRHRSHNHAPLDFSDEEPIMEELTGGEGGPDQLTHLSSDDIITVEFHSPAPDTAMASDLYPDWMKPPKPLQQKAGDPTAWTLSDFYDYLSPDDDLSALDTTPDPEPSPSPPVDMEDENPLLAGSPVAPDNTGSSSDAKPTPPLVVLGGQGSGMGGREGPDGCSLGFVRSDSGMCISQCDSQPDFCYNSGVCTVVAGVGAFCRCNVQDYVWNKGLRCDWVITEFQVLCLIVGVSSLMLLLLFMIIVFFAKRLHLLKRENKRLRKRSNKHRPHSEPQTDGFSVSTLTDGSHPNDDSQKLEDPVKSPPPVEEENLNIRNSHSPKHENNRPTSVVDHGQTPNNTDEMAEVNSHQNNMV